MDEQKTTPEIGLASRLQNADLVSIPLFDLVRAYLTEIEGQRLLLPSIQRSLVWSNEKIINYWDSLLRGWFPGLMLVHEAYSAASFDCMNIRRTATSGDFELLDGQQRMAAILLGFGIGPFAETRRLWIDLDGEQKGKMRFSLRVSSPGQPFGYQPTAPNSKLYSPESRKAWDSWLFGDKVSEVNWKDKQGVIEAMRERYENVLPAEPKLPDSEAKDDDVIDAIRRLRPKAFLLAKGKDLSGAGDNVFPLAPILRKWANVEAQGATLWPMEISELDARDAFNELKRRGVANVLKCPIAIKKVEKIFEKQGDYEEFFKRIGQGGMSLTDDELSYSLIKARIPPARQALENIVQDPKVGRLASPTQIALAGLRLARMQVFDGSNDIWKAIGRPSPEFVSGLPFENEQSAESKDNKGNEEKQRLAKLANKFSSMLNLDDNKNNELHALMLNVRELLGGKAGSDLTTDLGTAFPAILLGRLPKEMIDIGLMLVGLGDLKQLDETTRRAFCLWCITFGDASWTANELAREAVSPDKAEPSTILQKVIGKLEYDGHAKLAPTCENLSKIFEAIPAPTKDDKDANPKPLLHDGNARFKAEGVDQSIWSTISDFKSNSDSGKNALLWVQRNYLRRRFSDFDPTSDRDEDLPIDLDHIIPNDRFGFHWQLSGFPLRDDLKPLEISENKEVLDNISRYRSEIGNLIGNLRWLSSSENRGRGAARDGNGEDSLLGEDDVTEKIQNPVAGRDDVELKAKFGSLIDLPIGVTDCKGFFGWSLHDIRTWQYLVELRQLELLSRLIKDSKICDLLPKERGNHERHG